MAQVKYEPLEDNIDDIDRSMRQLIEQTDWYLNSIRSRPSNNSSSANESNASSSRDSSHTSSNAQTEQTFRIESEVSQHQNERSNDSSGSDTTILCSHDVELPEASTPIPNPVVDNSFGQEVIVIGTPAIETRVSRRARRTARSLNVNDTSVIDLSNYQEPESVVIISSDEEDSATPPNAVPLVHSSLPPPQPRQLQRQPCPSGSWSTILDGGYAVSVRTTPTQSISISLSSGNNARPGRVNIRSSSANNYQQHEVVLVNTVEPIPAPIALPAAQPALPPSRPIAPQAPAPKTDLNKTQTSRGSSIICPICYETLANRPAVSTTCGHVFCAECLQRAKQHANKCPVCKRQLTKANKTHPLYFATE